MLDKLQKEELFGGLAQLKNMDFCKNLQEITEGAVSNSSIVAGLGSADGPADSNSSFQQFITGFQQDTIFKQVKDYLRQKISSQQKGNKN